MIDDCVKYDGLALKYILGKYNKILRNREDGQRLKLALI